MSPLIIFMGVLTQILAVTSVDIELINKCTYSANRRILYCIGLENTTTGVADFITPETQMLFLRDTKSLIFRINHHAHSNYLKLINYQILNSKYLHISSGAFLGLSNVQYMEIHGNDWRGIEDNTFVGLRSLIVLNLSNNKIRTLNTYSFNHVSKLITLDLSDNLLAVIPSHIFEGNNQLETLYINNNQLRRVEENAFQGLSKLNILFLTNNSLEELNANQFNTLQSISDLNLNFNKINTIKGQLKLPKLKFLQVSHNAITNFENDIFYECVNLMSIDLSGNSLKDITEEPFLRLKKLRHLNLLNSFVVLSKFNTLRNYTTIIHN